MAASPFHLLLRRAVPVLALLALLQALLPGWHRLEHVDAAIALASAGEHHHGCHHDAPADEREHDGEDLDDADCPLCVALLAGKHVGAVPHAPVVVTAPRVVERLVAVALSLPPIASRWTPPARGPPRRS